jgi:hypothetical protein
MKIEGNDRNEGEVSEGTTTKTATGTSVMREKFQGMACKLGGG